MGLTGFIIVIAASIALLMLLVLKIDVHPIISLFIVAVFAGLLLQYGAAGTLEQINAGFAGTLQDIAPARTLV
ncbi:MAG: hypothetical protein PUC44_02005 [Eubacteriales bacterium]|nr:hypothetical protein [Eubacteriales bacterium]